MHAFATNLRFEDDEFNFVKARAQHGTSEAFKLRDEHFTVDGHDRPQAMLDHAQVLDAVVDADLVVLLAAVAHLTGDASLLERYDDRPRSTTAAARPPCRRRTPTRSGCWRPTCSAGLDPTQVLARPPVADELLHRIMEFCAGEPSAPSTWAWCARRRTSSTRTAAGSGGRAGPPTTSSTPSGSRSSGRGWAGSAPAIRLGQAGIPYTIFDKNAGVGGTWFENDYPDLRVDVPNHFYSYSFAPNPDWSDYYRAVTELAGVHRALRATSTASTEHVRFGHRGDRGRLRRDRRRAGRCEVRRGDGADGQSSSTPLISAVGMLNRPSVPDLDGPRHVRRAVVPLVALGPHDLDLTGKRVAVVGTGASAMQLVPAIAPAGRAPRRVPAIAALDDAEPRLPPRR